MLNLCIPVSFDNKQFNLDDIEWIINHKDEFIIPFVARKEEFPLSSISIQLCDWQDYKDDTYISMDMMIDLDNIDDFSLRVHEGFYCNTNERIIETDGFLDIKTDTDSIRQAINDIKNKQIPLWNRVKNISVENYPYIVEHEDRYEDY